MTDTRFVVAREQWMEHAACRGMGPARFYPDNQPTAAVLAICNTCPVAAECLAYAVVRRDRDGIWAGTTGNERQRNWRPNRRRGQAA